MRLDPYVYREYPSVPIPVPPLIDRGYARAPIPSAGLGPIVTSLNGLPIGSDAAQPDATPQEPMDGVRAALRNQFLTIGIPGVIFGATLLTLLSAWAFQASSDGLPKWKPALILGGGSLVTGLGLVAGTAFAISGPGGNVHPLLGMFTGSVMMGK